MFSYERAWLMADALECSLDELGGREWPPGGGPAAAALAPDEAALVGSYRRMEPEDRETIARTASTFALAGDAKKDEQSRPVSLAGITMTEGVRI